MANRPSCRGDGVCDRKPFQIIDLLTHDSDTAVFDANLPVTRIDTNITGIPDASYYGPRYFSEVLAKYPGPVIFGM